MKIYIIVSIFSKFLKKKKNKKIFKIKIKKDIKAVNYYGWL